MKNKVATQQEIIRAWFGPETRNNPEIHRACVEVSETFQAPSGATHAQHYTQKDRAAFAKAVQETRQMKKRTNLTLSEEARRLLTLHAKRAGTSVSGLIERLIREEEIRRNEN